MSQKPQAFGVTAGIFWNDSPALFACAEQMLIFPVAPLIIVGILVIELLSHSWACFELDSLLLTHSCGQGVDS